MHGASQGNRQDGPSNSGQRRWEHFPHGADLGVRGIGPTRAAAFEQAALALAAAVADIAAIRPTIAVAVVCQADDDILLLVDWLNAMIYEMAVRRMVFARFDVSMSGDRLDGVLWGEPADPTRHGLGTEPKGATYTAAHVERRADGTWLAQCVVDV